MPGKYCAFPGCFSNSSPKYDGVHFFQIPTRKSQYYDYEGWKDQVVKILSKYREIGKVEKKKIAEGKMHICSLHFATEDTYLTKTGKWQVDLGKLPSLNLPEKSHESVQPPERRHIDIVKETTRQENNKKKDCYSSFSNFEKNVERLKLIGWCVSKNLTDFHFKSFTPPLATPFIEVVVNQNLEYSVFVYGWSLPLDSFIYSNYERTLKNITISSLLKELTSLKICNGLVIDMNPSSAIEHSIPHEIDTKSVIDGSPMESKKYHRAKSCKILISADEVCENCTILQKKEKKEREKKEKHFNTPAKKNAPLSKTNPNRVLLALKKERADHKKEIKRIKEEIQAKGVTLENNISDDFYTIMEESKDVTPFMKLFWEEQKRQANGNPNSIRYHPMVIRFCISLAAKSPAAYDELRSSGILTLPSRRTLRDYTNVVKPMAGFNPQVIEALVNSSQNLIGYQRFMCLSFDEIKIQENLVFDKYSGELIGFVDLGNSDLNFSTFEDSNKLASYVMVFFLRSLAGKFKFSLSYFGTNGISAYQIMTLFWDAISILECIDIKVICCTSDGASPNRKFYKSHWLMDDTLSDVVYRTANLFAADNRYIYFFADVPHLVKTARNCLYNSGAGNNARQMWNEEGCLTWQHIRKLMLDDLGRGTKLIPKLSLEHINLTPYSKMKVSYATQVLSGSVAKVLQNYYSGVNATAQYCEMFDNFFDCLNARHSDESKYKLKPFLAPYTTTDDFRFYWLESVFLKYLENWKEATMKREGMFTLKEREMMFIARQTDEGLKITIKSLIDMTRFLLNSGMKYFFPVTVNQDCTEEHFGHHRGCGRRNTNPNLREFGYQENKLRVQKFVGQVAGNTSGRHEKRKSQWYAVDSDPLKKRVPQSGLF